MLDNSIFDSILKTGDNNSTIILDNLYTSLLEKSVEQWNIETLKSIESLTKTLCSSENIQIKQGILDNFLNKIVVPTFSRKVKINKKTKQAVHDIRIEVTNSLGYFMAKAFDEFGESLLIAILTKLYNNLNENLLSEYHKKFSTSELIKEINTNMFENVSQEKYEIIDNINCITLFNILKAFIEYINNEKYINYQNSILITLICYFSDINNSIRQLVMRNVTPTFFYNNQTKNKEWLKLIFNRIYDMFKYSKDLRPDSLSIIAKLFNNYMSIDEKNSEPLYDLRYENRLFEIIQAGLIEMDSLPRKFSVYLLKRIVDYSENHNENPNLIWPDLFNFNQNIAKECSACWSNFFLLYDMVQETYVHLVDPILPKFLEIIPTGKNESYELDISWILIILKRGFQNDAIAVRKRFVRFLIDIEDPNRLRILGSQFSFIFDSFLKVLDTASFYSVPGLGSFISPFGEALFHFTKRVVESFNNQEKKTYFLCELMKKLPTLGFSIPIIFMVQGLANVKGDHYCWGSEELAAIRNIIEFHKNFHKTSSRKIIRKYSLLAIIKYLNKEKASFSEIITTLSVILEGLDLNENSVEFKKTETWINGLYSNEEIKENLVVTLKSYLTLSNIDEDIPFEIYEKESKAICSVLKFTLKNSEISKQIVQQLSYQLSKIYVNSYIEKGLPEKLMVLLYNILKDYNNMENIDVLNILEVNESIVQNIINYCFGCLIDFNNDILLNINYSKKLISFITLFLCNIFDNDWQARFTNPLSINATESILNEKFNELNTVEGLIKSNDDKLNAQFIKINVIQLYKIIYQSAWLNEIFSFKSLSDNFIYELCKNVRIKKITTTYEARRLNWGNIIDFLCNSRWECIEYMLKFSILKNEKQGDEVSVTSKDVFIYCTEELENATYRSAISIFEFLKDLVNMEWEKTPDLIEKCFENGYKIIEENISNSKWFTQLINKYIDFVFQPGLLKLPELNEDSGPLKRAFSRIIMLGNVKTGVVNYMSTKLFNYWTSNIVYFKKTFNQKVPPPNTLKNSKEHCQKFFMKQLVELLIYGPLREKDDQKLESAIALKLKLENGNLKNRKETEGMKQENNEISEIDDIKETAEWNFSLKDYVVRVQHNIVLLKLQKATVEYRDDEIFAQKLLNYMIDLYVENTKPHGEFYTQYINTPQHRKQIRLWASICLLLNFIDVFTAENFINKIIDLISNDNCMLSTRFYMEIALMKILIKFPKFVDLILNQLDNFNQKAHAISSYITVVMNIGKYLPGEVQFDFFSKLFLKLGPWISSNHFTIRLFAQWAFSQSYLACSSSSQFSTYLQHSQWHSAINRFILNNNECKRFREKIFESSYYFSKFDIVEDFSVDFLFRILPTISGIAENERISAHAFEKIVENPYSLIPYRTKKNIKYHPSIFDVSYKPTESNDDKKERDALTDNTPIQKKIIPWEIMMQTDIDLSRETIIGAKKSRNSLIVIASLVSKAPNLGGLCRTCEIFNAEALVVSSLKIKQDETFKSLAVTSDKWVPMIEVTEENLPEYLNEKKKQGYALLGVEQTNDSVNLNKFHFPEKSVLLLGKEKEGIPVPLLQLLDTCIEIPQFGTIRSLNVHVSGALMIWEYTKQMIKEN
jgi:tRNA(Leu) C34 or U34 (ribose-2'-O)-methylase TrmL